MSIESTSPFLLHCPIFHDKRHNESNDFHLTETLLFGFVSLDLETNTLALKATIGYFLSTEIFKEPRFFKKIVFHMQFI